MIKNYNDYILKYEIITKLILKTLNFDDIELNT